MNQTLTVHPSHPFFPLKSRQGTFRQVFGPFLCARVQTGDLQASFPLRGQVRVAGNRLVFNLLQIILCTFCAEDYTYIIDNHTITCHRDTCAKVPSMDLYHVRLKS